MSYCKIYCDEPPTSINKCEILKPQLVRMSVGTRKVINFKLFETCFDNIRPIGRRIRNIANRFTPNLQLNDASTVYWKLVTQDGVVICNGTSSMDSDNLFYVAIPELEVSGYFDLVLFRRGEVADSRCIVKVFICP